MQQFGGKDLKRHFTVVMGGKEHGLYVSSTPSSAAKKAVTKLCTANKSKKVEFHIREITQGSKKKTYGPYDGYIEKLKEPIELKGRVIKYKPIAKLSGKVGKKSNVKKGGMRGGQETLTDNQKIAKTLRLLIEKNFTNTNYVIDDNIVNALNYLEKSDSTNNKNKTYLEIKKIREYLKIKYYEIKEKFKEVIPNFRGTKLNGINVNLWLIFSAVYSELTRVGYFYSIYKNNKGGNPENARNILTWILYQSEDIPLPLYYLYFRNFKQSFFENYKKINRQSIFINKIDEILQILTVIYDSDIQKYSYLKSEIDYLTDIKTKLITLTENKN